MSTQSLLYFLWFVLACLSYQLYLSQEEGRRLFEISRDLQQHVREKDRLIKLQQIYIEVLQPDPVLPESPSPLHGPF